MARDKDEQRGISTDELRQLQSKIREGVLRDILALDPNAITELSVHARAVADHFSDWHDRFRDGGGFADGFGKAGDNKAELIAKLGSGDAPELPGRPIDPKAKGAG